MPSAVFAWHRLCIFVDDVLKPPSVLHRSLSASTSFSFCLVLLNSEDVKTVARCSLDSSHECEVLDPFHFGF
jgi:hypothetical protein